MSDWDVILTGLPRSGTNLTCTLLNQVDNTVALAEPMNVGELARAECRVEYVRRFLGQQRATLQCDGTALTRHRGGVVRDNFFSDNAEEDGLRHSKSVREYIRFDKQLDSEPVIAVKHPSVFSALLPEFYGFFRCFALVRNPVSVLASWNANSMKVRDGRAPAAENVDTSLRRKLDATADRIDRQLVLLDWFFGQFFKWLPDQNIVRYENLIESRGGALSVIVPAAQKLDVPLESRNTNSLYGWKKLRPVFDRLMQTDGAFWHFYSVTDVRRVLDAAGAGSE
ncbi:MAG: hypothetical protein KDI75_04930 [Xanthomonadales bacterium]|nr:hypothetical protein [Xanthomonadales bacterium]